MKNRWQVLFSALLLFGAERSAAAEWYGYAFDGVNRTPVFGIKARVPSQGFFTFTNDSGYYHLGDTNTTDLARQPRATWDKQGQFLSIAADPSQPLTLEVFDLAGRLVARPIDRASGDGLRTWSTRELGLGLRPLVVRLRMGQERKSWSLIAGNARAIETRSAQNGYRSLAADLYDTLYLSALAFDTLRIVAPSGTRKMDTAWLAPAGSRAKVPWNAKIPYGSLVDARDGRSYKTVVIGKQRWMAENLDYSPVGDTSWCYGNKADSCAKYGRLYTWDAATGHEVLSAWSTHPVNGICPNGWHVPSQLESIELANFAEASGGNANNLKAIAGWGSSGNGSDAWGFRALPGGIYQPRYKSFMFGGFALDFWTTQLSSGDSTAKAFSLSYGAGHTETSRATGNAVRCLEGAVGKAQDSILAGLSVDDFRGNGLMPKFKATGLEYADTIPYTYSAVTINTKVVDTAIAKVYIDNVVGYVQSISINNPGTSKTFRIVVKTKDGDSLEYKLSIYRRPTRSYYGISLKPGISFHFLTDNRDAQLYNTVAIGSQTWMADNLNFKPSGADSGKCIGNSVDSCLKYGRLYNWNTIMAGVSSSSLTPSGVKGICPTGWHIPSRGEWESLIAIKGVTTEAFYLKSLAGWADDSSGTDDYGFRALPSGSSNGVTGSRASWWTSQDAGSGDPTFAGSSGIGSSMLPLSSSLTLKSIYLPVRCLQN